MGGAWSPVADSPVAALLWAGVLVDAALAGGRTPARAMLRGAVLVLPGIIALPLDVWPAAGPGLAAWGASLAALGAAAGRLGGRRSLVGAACALTAILAVDAASALGAGPTAALVDVFAPSACLGRLAAGALEVDALLALALPGVAAIGVAGATRRGLAVLVAALAVGATDRLPSAWDGTPGGGRGAGGALARVADSLDEPVLLTLVGAGTGKRPARDAARQAERIGRALARRTSRHAAPTAFLRLPAGAETSARLARLGVSVPAAAPSLVATSPVGSSVEPWPEGASGAEWVARTLRRAASGGRSPAAVPAISASAALDATALRALEARALADEPLLFAVPDGGGLGPAAALLGPWGFSARPGGPAGAGRSPAGGPLGTGLVAEVPAGAAVVAGPDGGRSDAVVGPAGAVVVAFAGRLPRALDGEPGGGAVRFALVGEALLAADPRLRRRVEAWLAGDEPLLGLASRPVPRPGPFAWLGAVPAVAAAARAGSRRRGAG